MRAAQPNKKLHGNVQIDPATSDRLSKLEMAIVKLMIHGRVMCKGTAAEALPAWPERDVFHAVAALVEKGLLVESERSKVAIRNKRYSCYRLR